MSDPYFQTRFADRIGGANYGKGTEIYKFEKIKRAKRKALAEHPERRLVDFGIGENDEMAPESVRAVMAREINRPENRGYADNGIAGLQGSRGAVHAARTSASSSIRSTEVNHCIGSKPALAMMPAAFINPGDVTLMTVPGYPVAGTHTRYYGGEVHRLPLLAKNDFFPDLESIPADVLRRTKLLVLNYPNSPTGRVATREFYQRVVEFALRHQHRGRARRGPHHAELRGQAAQFSVRARGEGSRRRNPFDVEGISHDRLAVGLGLRPRADRAGVCRRERQQRLGPVHRDPESGGGGARRHDDSAAGATKISPAAGKARGRAFAVRFHLPNAGRNLFSLHAEPAAELPAARDSKRPRRPANI